MSGGIGDLAVTLPELSIGPSVAGIDGSGAATIPAVMPDPTPQPQASGFSFAPEVESAIAAAAQKYGVPLDYMRQMAQIESGGKPNAYNKSGAAGLYQFIPDTAAAMGVKDPYDPVQAAEGAARYTLQNQTLLRNALGRDPTPGELYLAHQQGGGGARSLLTNPDAPATSVVRASHVLSNGGNANMTARDFASLWTSKFPGGSAGAGSLTPGYANPGMSVGSTATGGTFGLNGIQAGGTTVGGTAPAPGTPSLSAQPMTAMGPTDQTMMPPNAQQVAGQSLLQKLLNNNPNALSALGGAPGAAGKQAQQQKQGQQAKGMQMGQPYKPQTIGLQAARALFDPSRFYQALQQAGIRTGGQ